MQWNVNLIEERFLLVVVDAGPRPIAKQVLLAVSQQHLRQLLLNPQNKSESEEEEEEEVCKHLQVLQPFNTFFNLAYSMCAQLSSNNNSRSSCRYSLNTHPNFIPPSRRPLQILFSYKKEPA